MELFHHNIKFLMRLTAQKKNKPKLKYSDISKEIGNAIKPTVISNWMTQGHIPNLPSIKIMADYFAKELNISEEIFDNGKALLDVDFEKQLKHRNFLSQKNKAVIDDPELALEINKKIIERLGEGPLSYFILCHLLEINNHHCGDHCWKQIEKATKQQIKEIKKEEIT